MSLTTRLNYTVTPNLSVQLYAQPFVSAGDYGEFKQLADGRSRGYGDTLRAVDYVGNPDFNYRSFRTTNVVRWEYRPGSTLFVVWQQGREDVDEHGRFDFRNDVSSVFRLTVAQRLPGEVGLLAELLIARCLKTLALW